MISIENLPDPQLKPLIEKTIKSYFKEKALKDSTVVSVFFVSGQKMLALNKKFRKVNRTTNVLSFPLWEKPAKIPPLGLTNLGDIFLNFERIKKDAQIKKTTAETELVFLLRHSLDHLIGKHH